VLVLEAAPRAGGVLRTETLDGYRVERAATSFPSTAANLLALVRSLPEPPAMRESPPEASRQHLLLRRGLVPVERSAPAMLRSGLVPPGAAARAVLELWRGRRRGARAESAHEFVRRRFGARVADGLLAPMTLGIYGAHPGELGAADAFPALARMEREEGSVLRAVMRRRGAAARRATTFEGGMESLPRAIAAALGDDLRLSTRVESVAVDAEGAIVATAAEALRAREVVLATTAPEQARLIEPLSRGASEIVGAVRYVPMVVVAVGIPPGASPSIQASFGFLRGRGATTRILGASFASVLDPTCAPAGHALLTVFLGGSSDPQAIDLSDEQVRTVVVRDLASALVGPVRPDLVSVCRYARAIPVLSPGHRARMARAQSLLPRGVRLWGSHVTGVSLDSCCAPL
jgi:oxygen-dependent protoporphyrinogen oxidase